MGLLRSPVARLVAIALTQAGEGGLSLRGLARASGVRDSSAQRGVDLLLSEGVALRRPGDRGPTYVMAPHPLRREILALAFHETSRAVALRTLCLANPAVEFAGLDAQGLLLVFRERSSAEERLRLAHALDLLSLPLEAMSVMHDDLVERLLEHPELRVRAASSEILLGTLARSFPDRRRHGDPRHARRLGRPHPSFPHISRRELGALAREHGLRRIALFGSAVRSDFRPDSDIDVLIEPRPDARVSLFDLAAIEQRLEELFDRDVDVLTPGALRAGMRERIEREAVSIHG